jgi:cyclase
MLRTRVIPCLLIDKGRLVKTVQFSNPKYLGDPINAVKIFNDKEVDELILLDIAATAEKRKPDFNFIAQIAGECFMPMGYGGGIKSIEDIKTIFNLGVEKIILNNYAIENPEFVKKASDIFGSQSIIISIDVKNINGKYEVFAQNGKKPTQINPVDFALKMEKMGAGEILLNSIDRDGTMQGYDTELIERVAKLLTIPLVAGGGAGKIEDFVKATRAGASAVSAGSMFVFYGANRAVLINFPSREELEKNLS